MLHHAKPYLGGARISRQRLDSPPLSYSAAMSAHPLISVAVARLRRLGGSISSFVGLDRVSVPLSMYLTSTKSEACAQQKGIVRTEELCIQSLSVSHVLVTSPVLCGGRTAAKRRRQFVRVRPKYTIPCGCHPAPMTTPLGRCVTAVAPRTAS